MQKQSWKQWAKSYKGRKYWALAKIVNNPKTLTSSLITALIATGLYIRMNKIQSRKTQTHAGIRYRRVNGNPQHLTNEHNEIFTNEHTHDAFVRFRDDNNVYKVAKIKKLEAYMYKLEPNFSWKGNTVENQVHINAISRTAPTIEEIEEVKQNKKRYLEPKKLTVKKKSAKHNADILKIESSRRAQHEKEKKTLTELEKKHKQNIVNSWTGKERNTYEAARLKLYTEFENALHCAQLTDECQNFSHRCAWNPSTGNCRTIRHKLVDHRTGKVC